MGHGADGRLYSSVTSKDIAEKIKEKLGVEVDKRKILLKETIKAYGKYQVEVKILADITAKFVVYVHQ
jgi:large subunit ribosomal protein L9